VSMLGLRFVGGGGAVTPMNFSAIEVIGRGDRRTGGDGATGEGVTHSRYHDVAP
jgi:hypothetical protein